MVRNLLVLLLCLVAGCLLPEYTIDPNMTPACTAPRHVSEAFHADPAFDSQERAAFSAAVDDLFRFTDGQVNFVVAFDLDAHHTRRPQILRTYSWEPAVAQMEAERSDRYDTPGYELMGNASRGTQVVVLVMDRIGAVALRDGLDPLWYLRLMATHELAHMAGWGWPGCSGNSRVCHHSPDPTALMAANFSGQQLGEADRALCRASCLCR